MEEEKLGKLLNELAQRTAEPVRPGLAEEIKLHIPHRLISYRKGIHTVKIIIDLRINKLAAAGIVIATMIVLAGLFGGRSFTNDGIYQEGKLLATYFLGSGPAKNIATGRSMQDYLVHKGKEVVFYGQCTNPKDSNSILMHWKIAEGQYKVLFNNLHEEQVSAEELIKLQAQMLQKQRK